jgi:pimeloyl-ACP methyl ester carboxylesterase
VLVGHSIGGLIARVYAEHYPDEVAGMILVDPTHEDTILMYQGKLVRVRDGAKGVAIPPVQTMQSSPPNPPTAADIKQFEFNRKLFGAPKTEPPFDKLPATMQAVRLWFRSQPPRVATAPDFWAEELQAMYTARAKTPHQLGDKPLVVILAKSGIGNPPPGISAEEWKRVNEEKRQQKVGLTDLSRNSKLIVAERSGHHIQLDEPQVVTDAVLLLISAVRNETKPGANTLEHIPEPKMEEIRRIRRVDWPNPIVVVNSDSFYLIMFVHGERVQEELNLADLEKTLMELKLDRWPLGRVVVVQENGLRNPGENEKISAKAKEVKQMLELHRVMIELWPSG